MTAAAIARRSAVFAVGIFLAALNVLPAAAGTDAGYQDQSYIGSSPSTAKPESKLWWNDGVWWASMADGVTGASHIFRLNVTTQTWADTGTVIDKRKSGRADTLWVGSQQKLYVASHVQSSNSSTSTVGKPALLYRFSYDVATKRYALDPGFPVAINNVSSETLVLDRDSSGKLWATWTQLSQVYVNATTSDDLHWGTPFVPALNGTSLDPDDISSLLSFGPGKIGLMWSNQVTSAIYFAVHVDGQALTSWQASRTAIQGPKTADDHINLKTIQSDNSGRVFAAVKTSMTSSSAPYINLLVRDPATGDWSSYVFGRVSDHHSRPIVMLDEQHGVIHMFATGPTVAGTTGTGAIYEKTSPIANISFVSGLGTPVISNQADLSINNATSTKQAVNSTTGLVIVATGDTTHRYYHSYETIAP